VTLSGIHTYVPVTVMRALLYGVIVDWGAFWAKRFDDQHVTAGIT